MSQWASRDYMKVGNVINYAALVARGGKTIFCNKFLRTGPSFSFGLDYYVCLKRNSSYSIAHMHSSGSI